MKHAKRYFEKIDNQKITLALAYIGIPAIAYLYIDERAAFSLFIIVSILIGLAKEKYK